MFYVLYISNSVVYIFSISVREYTFFGLMITKKKKTSADSFMKYTDYTLTSITCFSILRWCQSTWNTLSCSSSLSHISQIFYRCLLLPAFSLKALLCVLGDGHQATGLALLHQHGHRGKEKKKKPQAVFTGCFRKSSHYQQASVLCSWNWKSVGFFLFRLLIHVSHSEMGNYWPMDLLIKVTYICNRFLTPQRNTH